MSRKDAFHELVKRLLIEEGRTITHDPYTSQTTTLNRSCCRTSDGRAADKIEFGFIPPAVRAFIAIQEQQAHVEPA
jgi:hypothetical protein